jgi:hypothetical protein
MNIRTGLKDRDDRDDVQMNDEMNLKRKEVDMDYIMM